MTIASLSSDERALIKAAKLGDSTLTLNADGKPTPGIEIGVAVTKSVRLVVGWPTNGQDSVLDNILDRCGAKITRLDGGADRPEPGVAVKLLAADDESKAFFQKMIGDYYRYVAESASGDKLEEVKNGALEGYQHAKQLSESLNACNPIRLGLALNFSVFYYEVMSNHKEACVLGEKALADALEKIDEVDEETFQTVSTFLFPRRQVHH